MAKFEIYTAKNGEFYFRLKAGNGQVILGSEGYKSKSGAENGVESVQKNATDDAKYEKKSSSKGTFSFSLKSGNGQVIGSSESYTTEAARDNGIESVKKNAPNAEVVEV